MHYNNNGLYSGCSLFETKVGIGYLSAKIQGPQANYLQNWVRAHKMWKPRSEKCPKNMLILYTWCTEDTYVLRKVNMVMKKDGSQFF